MTIASYVKSTGKKGLFTYRRRVPSDLLGQWLNEDGQPLKEVKVALKTKSRAVALQKGAEANLSFEQKAALLRSLKDDDAQKSSILRLQELKNANQAATQMLRAKGVLPEQQPNLALGATIDEVRTWHERVKAAESNLIDALDEKYTNHTQQQQDYDNQRWGVDYKIPREPIPETELNLMALNIISGITESSKIHPTWRDAVTTYTEDTRGTRSSYDQKKHEQRTKRAADDLAKYLGNGNINAGYTTRLTDFSKVWIRGFPAYCDQLHPNWSYQTFNRLLKVISAIFNKAKSVFEIHNMGNPFSDLKREAPASHVTGSEEKEDRRSFSPSELGQYWQHLHELKPDIKLIGLLMVATGARTNEIAGLKCNDVILSSNVAYLEIRPNSIRGLKTKSSKRKIPLTTAAQSALQDYLAHTEKLESSGPLFPRYGRSGGRDAASQTLRHIIRNKMGVDDPTLVPYSTRHTMKDKLRALRTPVEFQWEILGHERKGSPVAEGYGDGGPLVFMQQELERAAKLEDWGLQALL